MFIVRRMESLRREPKVFIVRRMESLRREPKVFFVRRMESLRQEPKVLQIKRPTVTFCYLDTLVSSWLLGYKNVTMQISTKVN